MSEQDDDRAVAKRAGYSDEEFQAMADQARIWRREAERAWRRGEPIVMLPFKDYLALKTKRDGF